MEWDAEIDSGEIAEELVPSVVAHSELTQDQCGILDSQQLTDAKQKLQQVVLQEIVGSSLSLSLCV